MEYSLWSWAQSSFHLVSWSPGSLLGLQYLSLSSTALFYIVSNVNWGQDKMGGRTQKAPKTEEAEISLGGCAYSGLATKAPVSHSSVECFRCKAISIMTDDNMASCTHQNLDEQILGPSGCWSGCWLPSTHSSH